MFIILIIINITSNCFHFCLELYYIIVIIFIIIIFLCCAVSVIGLVAVDLAHKK
jgi:hypothetical protein